MNDHPCQSCSRDASEEQIIYCPLAGEELLREDCTWIYNLPIRDATSIFEEFNKQKEEIESKNLRKCRCGNVFEPQKMGQVKCQVCIRKHSNKRWNEVFMELRLPVRKGDIAKGKIKG